MAIKPRPRPSAPPTKPKGQTFSEKLENLLLQAGGVAAQSYLQRALFHDPLQEDKQAHEMAMRGQAEIHDRAMRELEADVKIRDQARTQAHETEKARKASIQHTLDAWVENMKYGAAFGASDELQKALGKKEKRQHGTEYAVGATATAKRTGAASEINALNAALKSAVSTEQQVELRQRIADATQRMDDIASFGDARAREIKKQYGTVDKIPKRHLDELRRIRDRITREKRRISISVASILKRRFKELGGGDIEQHFEARLVPEKWERAKQGLAASPGGPSLPASQAQSAAAPVTPSGKTKSSLKATNPSLTSQSPKLTALMADANTPEEFEAASLAKHNDTNEGYSLVAAELKKSVQHRWKDEDRQYRMYLGKARAAIDAAQRLESGVAQAERAKRKVVPLGQQLKILEADRALFDDLTDLQNARVNEMWVKALRSKLEAEGITFSGLPNMPEKTRERVLEEVWKKTAANLSEPVVVIKGNKKHWKKPDGTLVEFTDKLKPAEFVSINDALGERLAQHGVRILNPNSSEMQRIRALGVDKPYGRRVISAQDMHNLIRYAAGEISDAPHSFTEPGALYWAADSERGEKNLLDLLAGQMKTSYLDVMKQASQKDAGSIRQAILSNWRSRFMRKRRRKR